MESLYQQLIVEHYRHPRNKGDLPDPTAEVHVNNPVCGDEIRLQLVVQDGVVRDASFEGRGCSISQASASMMTERVKGRSVEEALRLAERFTEVMRGNEEAARDKDLGDLRALQGVSRFPARIKCALLGFDALREALAEGEDHGDP